MLVMNIMEMMNPSGVSSKTESGPQTSSDNSFAKRLDEVVAGSATIKDNQSAANNAADINNYSNKRAEDQKVDSQREDVCDNSSEDKPEDNRYVPYIWMPIQTVEQPQEQQNNVIIDDADAVVSIGENQEQIINGNTVTDKGQVIGGNTAAAGQESEIKFEVPKQETVQNIEQPAVKSGSELNETPSEPQKFTLLNTAILKTQADLNADQIENNAQTGINAAHNTDAEEQPALQKPAMNEQLISDELISPNDTKPITSDEPISPNYTKQITSDEPIELTNTKQITSDEPIESTNTKQITSDEPIESTNTKQVTSDEPIELSEGRQLTGESQTAADKSDIQSKAEKNVSDILSYFEKNTKETAEIPDNIFVRQVLDEANAQLENNSVADGYKALETIRPLAQNTEAEGQGQSEAEDNSQQPAQQKASVSEQPVNTTFALQNNNFQARLDSLSEAQPNSQTSQAQNVRFQILEQVTSMINDSKQELTLQLKPHHLGGLTITLTQDQNGVTAKLVTASKDAHALIQSEMAQMQETLRDKGIHVVEMEVIYDQMANATGKDNSDTGYNNQQRNNSYAAGNQGRLQTITEEAAWMYEDITGIEVLAEQGGSVEFSA